MPAISQELYHQSDLLKGLVTQMSSQNYILIHLYCLHTTLGPAPSCERRGTQKMHTSAGFVKSGFKASDLI